MSPNILSIFEIKRTRGNPPPIVNFVRPSEQTIKMTEDNKLASLIAGCRQMNESSQLELYRLFYSYGMAICLRFTPNRESALETLNDGFLKAFLKIDQYDSNYTFKPWFRKILVNASIEHYRKYNKPKSDELWQVKEDSPSYNEALDHLDFEDLLKVMQLLPAGYRMVLYWDSEGLLNYPKIEA